MCCSCISKKQCQVTQKMDMDHNINGPDTDSEPKKIHYAEILSKVRFIFPSLQYIVIHILYIEGQYQERLW